MARKDRYSPDVSFADLMDYIEAAIYPRGLWACWVVTPQPNLATGAYLEVILYPVGGTRAAADAYITRSRYDPRGLSRQHAQVLRALVEALESWDNDPWRWSAEERKRARGEL